MVIIFILLHKRRCKKAHLINQNICAFTTNRQISKFNMTTNDKIFNVKLTDEEVLMGTRFGIDSHADTCCVNKHAYVETIVEGITVDAIPFDSQLGKMSDLPIVHAIFAYDDNDNARTTLIRVNNAIYIKDMESSLLCPIKLEHTVLSLMTFLHISTILALERSLLLSITKNSTYIHMDQLHIYLLGDQPMMNSNTAILLTLRRSTTGNLIRVQILTSPSHKTQVQSRRSP